LVLTGLILNRLRDSIIFTHIKKSGVFVVIFKGEKFYSETLSIDQVMQFSQEIANLAQKARQEKGAE
jgi:hypothetical protein